MTKRRQTRETGMGKKKLTRVSYYDVNAIVKNVVWSLKNSFDFFRLGFFSFRSSSSIRVHSVENNTHEKTRYSIALFSTKTPVHRRIRWYRTRLSGKIQMSAQLFDFCRKPPDKCTLMATSSKKRGA